jgi:superfamily I DNA/RNA helicase
MINRLVDWLLRENRDIRRALQATYPFVFLDEFQDTTYAQFELLHTAFDGSGAIFTAVGDDKQRIMGWAGAMPDAFDRFEADFNAIRIPLVSNWRSHEDLVRIQHVIAQRIDPEAEAPEARAERDVDGDIAAIWQYDTSEDEANGLAAWIAGEIANGIDPHEIAILVRLRANEVEQELAPSLSQHGVRLRNSARNIGDIAIQDLLGEELTAILLPLLRLGATRKDPDAWNSAQRSLQFLEGIYPDDDAGQQRLQQRLQTFVRELRTEMSALEPTGDAAHIVARRALDFVGPSILRRTFPAYQRKHDFDRVWDGFAGLLAESANGTASWTESLDQFEGLGQVALMTIHKSKGLEFHTMIFYGLDNQTWWSLRPNSIEELNSFFVAFTRARQRAFFTLCTGRGGPVAWIENLLASAGVHRVAGPD